MFCQQHVGNQSTKLLKLQTVNRNFWPARNLSDGVTFPLGLHPMSVHFQTQCFFFIGQLWSQISTTSWILTCGSAGVGQEITSKQEMHAWFHQPYGYLDGTKCNLTILLVANHRNIHQQVFSTSLLLLYCHCYLFSSWYQYKIQSSCKLLHH